VTRRWLWVLPAVCGMMSACPEDEAPRRPDPTKGTITGIVLCTDTGKPARFANVQLLPAALFHSSGQKQNGDLDLDETAVTDLDGRFTIEAVPPGDYFAYATQAGYLDPERAVDFASLGPKAGEDGQLAAALNQWKDHFVELMASAQHTTGVTIEIDRGAEIEGTVSYDDASPAIGMRFDLLRKTAEDKWIEVGQTGSNWTLEEASDGHGRYRISNLPAGEYKVCTLLPDKDEHAAERICAGNTFRTKNAATIKVSAGETRGGADIAIPLTGMYTVAGRVTVGVDGHVPGQATVHLLYADDREEARSRGIRKDGSFSFAYVPADKYIVEVTDAKDARGQGQSANSEGGANSDSSGASDAAATEEHRYTDKEISLNVQSDMNDADISLVEAVKAKAGEQ